MAPCFEDEFDYLPIIPERVLRAHHVHQPLDTRFRSAARLLQALWRENRDLPIGHYSPLVGRRAKLGSRISEVAGAAGGNFLSPAIAHLAARETIYREPGALIDEERLFTNLLSSMPLAFNLLGPLRLDKTLATGVIQALIPDFRGEVVDLRFEHAPARGNERFTGDYTAFDALIRYTTVNGRRGFIAIELKYAETCAEPAPKIRPRYAALSRETGLFIDPNNPHLRANPLQQLWREHCLAQAMVQHGPYDEGHFMLVAPCMNWLVQNAASGYRSQLNEASGTLVPFHNVTIESMIDAIAANGASAIAAALHRRYCDWWLVDGEIELALSGNKAAVQPARDEEIESEAA